MQYYTNPDIQTFKHNVVATTGFFDGIHRGHQKVIREVVKSAAEKQMLSAVITFWPHPRIVLNKDVSQFKLLSTLDEKRYLIENLGVDDLIVVPFTYELSQLSAEDFFKQILIEKLKVKSLIVGYDHHFGKGGQANFGKIKEIGEHAGVCVERIEANSINGVTISSSKIREALQNGDIIAANEYLGYNYPLSGTVVHGKKLGRKMGFPTANIQPDDVLKLIPQDGIYAVKVIHNNITYNGMLSIGIRPTIDDERQRTIEVNIFDFDKTIYGDTISLQFIARLRNELKFDSINELRLQIEQDKIDSITVLNAL